MSVNPFSPDSMHYVDPEALKELHDTNATMLDAKYAGDVASVRASYLGKLAEAGALIGGDGWALFDLERGSWGNIAVMDRPKKMMVHVSHVPGVNTLTPKIRIFTNETFEQEASTFYLTEDVTVDHEDDAQMLVSMAELKGNTLVVQAETFEVMDGIVEATPTYAALFFLVGEKFQCVNLHGYTPQWGVVNSLDQTAEPVLPFGTYEWLEDKWYALGRARDLFADIKDLEPIAQSAE